MARRGSGVEVRENSIRLSFTFDGEPHRHTLHVNGEPIKPTAANVKYAHRVAGEIREKIALGIFVLADYFPHAVKAEGAGTTVAWAIEHFKAAMRTEASTRKAYNSALKFWGDPEHGLGKLPYRALKRSDILKALNKRPTLSGKTVANYVSVLRSVFQLLVDDKVLKDNPVGRIEVAHQKPGPDPFTREEMDTIIADITAHYDEAVLNYTEARFFTGCRPSELAGLRWSNVDMRAGYFLVEDVIVEDEAKPRTKTANSRKVIMNSRAKAAFQRQMAHTYMRDREGHVFIDPRRDEPWTKVQYFVRFYWQPSLARTHIRYREPYNTRHTYATMMLMAGMAPAFCARQLGHDVKVFLTTYSRWLDGAADAVEMQRLESAISPAASPKEPGSEASA